MFFSAKYILISTGIVASLLFCKVVSSAEEPSSPMRGLGVATHMYGWDDKALLPVMKQLGVTVFRDSICWNYVEKQKGKYKIPPRITTFMERITGSGIKMIVALYYSNKIYDNPHDPKAFANYCRFVASKLKGKPVAAFEIYNEPNGWFRPQYGGAWNGKDNALWIEKFAEYMSTAAAAIREVDQTTPIISGGGVPCATAYLMKRFPKAFKNIDGLTEHPYSFSLPPETIPWGGAKILERDGISVANDDHSITSLINTLRRHSKEYLGRELPVWVTEVGFSNYYDQKRPAQDRGFTQKVQAMYLARSLIIGMASGAKVWCIYNLMDTADNRYNSNYNFGLVRNSKYEYKPKPAFYAIQHISQLLGSDWKYITKPNAKLDVVIARKKKYDVWQAPMIDPFVKVTGPMMHWFKIPDGYVTFVWNAGRYHGEFNPPFGDLLWTHNKNIKNIDAFEITTGRKLMLQSVRKGNSVCLKDIPIGGSPIAIKWTMGSSTVTANTKSYEDIWTKGKKEYNDKKYQEAANTLNKAVQKAITPSEKYNSMWYRGNALKVLKKFGEATIVFENLLKIEGLSEKQKEDVFKEYINSIYWNKKYQEALTVADRIVSDDKATQKMKTTCAYIACCSAEYLKKYDDMERFGKIIVELNLTGLWYGRGFLCQAKALKGQKKYDEAFALLNKENISKMHPNDQGVAYLERGHIAIARKKYPQAVIEYTNVYELPRGLVQHKEEAIARLIFAMSIMEQSEKITVWIKRIDGIKNKYWKACALLYCAQWLEKQGRYKDAKEKWRACKTAGPWWAKLAEKRICKID